MDAPRGLLDNTLTIASRISPGRPRLSGFRFRSTVIGYDRTTSRRLCQYNSKRSCHAEFLFCASATLQSAASYLNYHPILFWKEFLMKRALRLVSMENAEKSASFRRDAPADDQLLDAYSKAVTAAAGKVSPSVVNIEGARRLDHQYPSSARAPAERRASGSGLVFTPAGA